MSDKDDADWALLCATLEVPNGVKNDSFSRHIDMGLEDNKL